MLAYVSALPSHSGRQHNNERYHILFLRIYLILIICNTLRVFLRCKERKWREGRAIDSFVVECLECFCFGCKSILCKPRAHLFPT